MRIINKILYIIGLAVLLVSWVQWFFRYPDTSQLFLGLGIGICILGFGYIYGWMISKDESQNELQSKIEGLIKLYTKGELE